MRTTRDNENDTIRGHAISTNYRTFLNACTEGGGMGHVMGHLCLMFYAGNDLALRASNINYLFSLGRSPDYYSFSFTKKLLTTKKISSYFSLSLIILAISSNACIVLDSIAARSEFA